MQRKYQLKKLLLQLEPLFLPFFAQSIIINKTIRRKSRKNKEKHQIITIIITVIILFSDEASCLSNMHSNMSVSVRYHQPSPCTYPFLTYKYMYVDVVQVFLKLEYLKRTFSQVFAAFAEHFLRNNKILCMCAVYNTYCNVYLVYTHTVYIYTDY